MAVIAPTPPETGLNEVPFVVTASCQNLLAFRPTLIAAPICTWGAPTVLTPNTPIPAVPLPALTVGKLLEVTPQFDVPDAKVSVSDPVGPAVEVIRALVTFTPAYVPVPITGTPKVPTVVGGLKRHCERVVWP
jgi:hypothetical protein